jgi:transcription factor SFP1
MAGPAAPIDIATRQTSISPPGQQASNLTSALQRAGDGDRSASDANLHGPSSNISKTNVARKDSFGASMAQFGNGTKPITVNGSNRDKRRRESLAGSLVGGMSWGGVSVGSWIRDEYVFPSTHYQKLHAGLVVTCK